MQAPVLRRRRSARRAGAARRAPHDDDDARPGPRAAARLRRWSATARRRDRARAQRHAHAARRRPVRRAAGERFDAHDFLRAGAGRRRRGRARRARPRPRPACPACWCADTLRGAAASWPPRGARASQLPLIAVTGSNGKTTVTQMIAVDPARLARRRARFATAGQPQQPHRRAADAAAPARTQLAPRRRGRARHEPPGRDRRSWPRWRAPTVALVNNAQREHQEFMASVEAVARENGAVIEALRPDGVAVFPADDALRAAVARAGRRAAAC